MKYLLLGLCLMTLLSLNCNKMDLPLCETDYPELIKGLSFVAPPNEFFENPMPAIKAVNAEWIAVIPYAFTIVGDPQVHYNSGGQWWGERPEGVRETITKAKEVGLKIMLKPQVYVPNSWTGGLDFDSDEKWTAWETDYEAYLIEMVEIGEDLGVEMICIGTEFKISTSKRAEFWRKLTTKVRAIYSGKLTYSANWDNYQNVPFWEVLDYVGISMYQPLLQDDTPTVNDLKKVWEEPVNTLHQYHCTINKPILFTEFGYLSVDGCAWKTWELESQIHSLSINEQAQANAYEALFDVFYDESWWVGGFLWKWFPNMEGGEGYNERDYTPQGKQAEETIKEWYGKEN